MKAVLFWMALSVLTIAILVYSYTIISSPDEITAQEYKFLDKLRSHLKNQSDIVKVSDVHEGDWLKVCAFFAGFHFDLGKFVTKDRLNVEILNNTSPYLTDWGDESAIVFVYPDNKAEIYRMVPDYAIYSSNTSACIEKQNAYLKVRRTYEDFSEEFKLSSSKSLDFMSFLLTRNKE